MIDYGARRGKWKEFKNKAEYLKKNIGILPLEDFFALADEMLTVAQEENEEDGRILH